MQKDDFKNELDTLVNELPEDTNWDELMYKIYVRQSIEEGLQNSKDGNTTSHEEIKRKYQPAQ